MSNKEHLQLTQIKHIAICAPLTSYSGYGQYGRAISAMVLQSYKENQYVKISLFDISGNAAIDPSEVFQLQKSKYRNIQAFVRPLQQIQTQFYDVVVTVSVPQSFVQKGLINIGVTALAQVDKVHPQLIQHCNRMDEVCVMSEFNIDTIKRSMFKLQDGTSVEITVPLNIIHSPFVDIDQTEVTDVTEFINNIPQQFLFLAVGQWLPGNVGSDRKDIGALISTFLRGFQNNKDIGLVLKANQGRSSLISQYVMRERITEISKILGISITQQNIYFISGNLSQSQVKQIYTNSKIKAMVSFSHAQSYGIPLMQFAGMTGKPILTPYHSGMMQYLKPQYSEILIHKETQVPQELFQTFYRDFMIPQSKWFTIDYQYALYKMGQVVTNYNGILQRAKKQQQNILDNFNLSILSKNVKSILDKHLIS